MADMRLIDANTVEKLSFYTTRKNDDYIEGYFDGVRDAKEVVRNSETHRPGNVATGGTLGGNSRLLCELCREKLMV